MTPASALPRARLAAGALGGVIALAGLVMMAGWLLEREAIARAFPGFLMVFNTTLGFAVAGLALVIGTAAPAARRTVKTGAGLVLTGLGALVLIEHLLGVSLGIDWPRLHTWLPDPGGNRFPGRMSLVTSFAFVLAGAVFLVVPRARVAAHAYLVRALTAAVGVIGAISAAGYVLGLAEMLDFYLLVQVALPTAICFVALALGLWVDWRGEPWNAVRLFKREDDRIAVAGAMVLAASSVAVAIAAFWLMQSTMERVLTADLELELKSRRARMVGAIEHGFERAAEVSERPVVQRIYASHSRDAAAADHPARLREIANVLVESGFSALAFLDADGRDMGHGGNFLEDSPLRLPLQHGGLKADLLWDGDFVLETRIDVAGDGARLGRVRAQYRLAELKGIMTEVAAVTGSSEFVICALSNGMLRCAPTRLQPVPFETPGMIKGNRLPMSYAVEGGSGVRRSEDYRGKQVLAAYSALGTLGPGLVLKVDLSDLYAPIRERLGMLALALLLIGAAGGWALHLSVRPLVRRLVQTQERLGMALDGSQLAIWDWDIAAGRVYLSEQWSAMLGGVPRAMEISIGELNARVHPDDAVAMGEKVRAMLKGVLSHYSMEHRVRTFSGDWLWIKSRGQVVERARDRRALRAIGTNVDISDRKIQELSLVHRADHDALTGLPNRSLFQDRLEQTLRRSRRGSKLMAVLYIDADKFKRINDTLGHAVGDAVLKEFAHRLTLSVRATDTVARLGGDEFAVVLEDLATRDDGMRIAGGIVEAMRSEFVLEAARLSISASVGIAFHDGTAQSSPQELLKAADRALYQAKGAGRDGLRAAA